MFLCFIIIIIIFIISGDLPVTFRFVLSQDAAAPAKASRSKENQQQVVDEAGLSSIAAPASSTGFASENGGSLHLVRVGHSKRLMCFVLFHLPFHLPFFKNSSLKL